MMGVCVAGTVLLALSAGCGHQDQSSPNSNTGAGTGMTTGQGGGPGAMGGVSGGGATATNAPPKATNAPPAPPATH